MHTCTQLKAFDWEASGESLSLHYYLLRQSGEVPFDTFLGFDSRVKFSKKCYHEISFRRPLCDRLLLAMVLANGVVQEDGGLDIL